MTGMSEIVLAVVLLLALGLLLGLVIGIAVKLFGVEVDPKLEQVEDLLPGANCGACGSAGCADFARALLKDEGAPDACTSASSEVLSQIAAVLGVSLAERTPNVAVVLCGGDSSVAKAAAKYNGVADCRSAVLVAGGAKGCRHGCLGLASCARACPFGAIEITPDGLAVVHAGICTGCGKCVATCPRNLIALVPATVPIHVLCSSPEKGAAKGKVCKRSCIGCRKCAKNAGEGQIVMDGFLARVNLEDPPGAELAKVCPTKCLQPSVPAKPSEAGVQDQEQREVVNA